MASTTRSGDAAIAAACAALAKVNRLELLRILTEPHQLAEIELRSGLSEGGAPISRQAIKEHLVVLMNAGLVAMKEDDQGGRTRPLYSIDHSTIYALSEEIRGLARLRSTATIDKPTVIRGAAVSRDGFPRPCLVVTKGLDEGRAVPLVSKHGKTTWTIGRRAAADICMDYDPFVSQENTRIHAKGGGYVLEDLPTSRNGTMLNFQPLAPSIPVPLQTGDLLGVGRSLFLFLGRQ
ncbi:MAG: FHA domain-containing protein [Thermoplasmatota archaeon]